VAAIIALWTRRIAFVELAYYWSFTASLQATLTPDLGATFPDHLRTVTPPASDHPAAQSCTWPPPA
jgi:uncharacterized membrane protein YwaF